MVDKKSEINQFNIYKLVNKRLGLVLLIILPIVGVSSYFVQQHRLLNNIQEIVIKRSEQFTLQLGKQLADSTAVDNGTLQKSFDEFSESEIIYTEGFFIGAIIVDNRGIVSAHYQRKNSPLSSGVTDRILMESIKKNQFSPLTVQRFNRNKNTIFLLDFPIQSSNKEPLGQAALLFLPSPTELSNIKESIWKTTLAATMIVLLTTLFFYPVIIRLVKQLASLSFNLLNANLETINALGNAIAKRDADTDAHNYRVSIYSVRLAEALNLDKKTIQGLIKGAFLHDIGKIGTPDNILLKAGKLTDKEFEEMKKHVNHGVEIINNSSWLLDGKDIVLHHHQKYNGSGYSTHMGQALTGKEIPIVARIFAIADVFDALTSRRPYKEPFDFDTSMMEMEQNVTTHFDPKLFSTFKTIAKPLYEELANQEGELPKQQLFQIIQKYFLDDLEQFLS